jgi:CspA family cold shock protein
VNRLGRARHRPFSTLSRHGGVHEEDFTLMAVITGTVKFFNTTKGFGFISPEGGGKDAFVHISAVQRSGLQGLYENDKVTYELETGRDGKESAVNITLLS